MAAIDVLMITYQRPDYVRRSLPHLLESCTEDMRVWLWHNGTDADTLNVVRSYVDHPKVARFHHSPENLRLRAPTNWLWAESDADLLSKVDDDCLPDTDWAARLARAHEDVDEFGVIGSWRFYDEDFLPDVAQRKIRGFPGGHQLLENFWVQGSGYLMKRACVEQQGLLAPGQSFTAYCIDLALKGWVNGWYFPFIHEEHMDDPRSPNSLLRTDDDLHDQLPLSAQHSGVATLQQWEEQMRRSARRLQEASVEPRDYRNLRRTLRSAWWRVQRRLEGRKMQSRPR
ncbi:glycosyltransferase [Egibacter rhizosphaerae]|uniref:Glycosyltransferase n=1 Tax=Egibacter rhizosphaerae TaxID=1670831 RepID=A0A411YGI8_9ACTN|nr:glycosyltransferase family A protein [Egibacter rhizosphaerae]QBI20287.1 glycosyltransferase [Egibacter rhizosphaerae]